MNILITGASRGIGLELTRMALQKGHSVLAVSRNAIGSDGLQKLGREYKGRLTPLNLDLTQPDKTEVLRHGLKQLGNIDVLINNAGTLEGEGAGLTSIEAEDLRKCFETNVIAPIEVTKACLDYLEKSAKPCVVNITSLMGSLSDNKSGGYYAYRISKSALNMFTRSLAIDHPRITSVVLHPGWVKTDMGGPEAPLTTTESATGLWKVIETLGKEQTGRFFDFRGRELPW